MLDKKYNHEQVELNKYENWKTKGYFKRSCSMFFI